MGNDQSHTKGLEIDKKAIQTTDFWSIYNGEVRNKNSPATSITIFQGEQVVTGQLWVNKSPLQRATRNFMLYRHPSILRFHTSWEKGSVHYLATERCKQLTMVLASQNDTQICLGLRNILCALIFLVEKANMCHLNVCTSSIYVNANGSWRLGGFEHLWQQNEVNQKLLERSQPYRYKNALDKDETKRSGDFAIEQFAFGVLCEEIFSSRKDNNSTIPNVAEFRKYCVEHLRNSNAQDRPSLSAILLHSYFNQDFILIHSFLSELPLKDSLEKQTFFTGLVDRLRAFDETVVATELIDLILSRIVLLDETAKLPVIPFILQPYIECESEASINPIFSIKTFTKYVTPKIQQLFLVRDIQIRLVLLEYFPAYMNYFESKELLSDHILPQLLLGIKDTNDEIVAATLRCLADLVPVLGSSIVIGRNRGRIFADGKPNGIIEKHLDLPNTVKWPEARSITPVMNGAGINTDFVSNSPLATDTTNDISDSFVSIVNSQTPNNDLMPERLSPDGGEDIQSINRQSEFDDEDWSDWDNNDTQNEQNHINANKTDGEIIETENLHTSKTILASKYQRSLSISSTNSTNFIKDVKEIEIKPTNTISNEIDDFFKEMEPVIATNSSLSILSDHINEIAATEPKKPEKTSDLKVDQTRFAVKTNVDDDIVDDTAWDADANDWDD